MKIATVTSIENFSTKSKRYDITVQDNHNFFANNILVHNCQNLPHYFEQYKGKVFEVSVKVDGSSMTVYYYKGTTGVCSRNLELKKPNHDSFWIKFQQKPFGKKFVKYVKDNFFKYKIIRDIFSKHFNLIQVSSYWQEAIKNQLIEKLNEYGKDIALQMELYGEGIQENPEKIKGTDIAIYDVYLIKEHRYASPEERVKILDEMGLLHKQVKILGHFEMPANIEEALKMASGPSIHNEKEREGIVFKGHGTSFKVISNEYLLKHGNR